jgi:hypothetical protein
LFFIRIESDINLWNELLAIRAQTTSH